MRGCERLIESPFWYAGHRSAVLSVETLISQPVIPSVSLMTGFGACWDGEAQRKPFGGKIVCETVQPLSSVRGRQAARR